MGWEKYPYKGQMMTITQASNISGLSETTLRKHVKRQGMTLQEACELPLQRGLPRYAFHGMKLTKAEIAELAEVNTSALSNVMYRYGISPGEAADYLIDCRKEYPYNGKTVTLTELENITKCKRYSLYNLIIKQGMSAEAAVAAAKGSDGVMTKCKAARKICGEIFAGVIPEEVHFRKHSDTHYSFSSELYRYEVRFSSPLRARLTAFFRDPELGDSVSTMWDYEINRNSIKRIGRAEK